MVGQHGPAGLGPGPPGTGRDHRVRGGQAGEVEVPGDLLGRAGQAPPPQFVGGNPVRIVPGDHVHLRWREQHRVQAVHRVAPRDAGHRVGDRRDHVTAPCRQPPHDVQQVTLAVGRPAEPALPFGGQHLAKLVLRVDGAVVGERVGAETERVGVGVADAQARRCPAQVHQAEIAERPLGQPGVFGLLRRAAWRLAHLRPVSVVPGHAPAIAMKVRQRGERAQPLLGEQARHGRAGPGTVTKQTAHGRT